VARFPTVVPAQTIIRGEVRTRGDLTLEGTVEGSLHVDGTLSVAAGATCVAQVSACRATIYGTVLGNVVCSESIVVGPGARVVGDLRAPEIVIDSDGRVEGHVDLLPPPPALSGAQRLPLTVRGPVPRRPASPGPSRTIRPAPGADFDDQETVDHDRGDSQRTTEVLPIRRPIPTFPRPTGKVRIAARPAQPSTKP
jgi:cytoskeletal protein CcmA (bactofilin family)